MITDQVKKQIIEYAESNSTEEVCAFIVKDDNDIIFLHPVANRHPQPKCNFLINPLDYLKIKNKYIILALFHSHNGSAEFSKADLHYHKYHNIDMVIYDLKTKSFNFFYV